MPLPLTVLASVLGSVLVLSGPGVWGPERSPAPETVDPVGVWPLAPVPPVVRGFDPPTDRWGAGHRGVDLLGSPGAAVRATLAGRVTFAGRLAGRGVVVVDHGPTRTTYEPVSALAHVGETVAAGQRIGTLEVIGSHCFPRACLHWGWIRGAAYLDPLDLVGAGPVRLLPLWRPEPVARPDRPSLRLPYARWRPPVEKLVGD